MFFGRQIDLGLRAHFGAGSQRIVPYADLAYTLLTLTSENDDGVAGTGFSGGAGVQVFASETFALRVGALGTLGSYGTSIDDGEREEQDDSIGATNLRLVFGLSFYPMR